MQPTGYEYQQGEMAVRAGAAVGYSVRSLLVESGNLIPLRDVRSLQRFATQQAPLFGDGVFAEDVEIGTCHYGRPLRIPYLMRQKSWPSNLGLEVQHQDLNGSADAKLVKSLMDLRRVNMLSVLLLTGMHMVADQGIRDFVCRFIRNHPETLCRCFVGEDEFRRWVIEGMPWPGMQ